MNLLTSATRAYARLLLIASALVLSACVAYAPPPPPQQAAGAPEPDPIQQMAHQQAIQNFLRSRDVNSLNSQIKDTTNQLRNAQIFGTGQETYLQQQLAQLIAMKV
jgi:hypothetical protein